MEEILKYIDGKIVAHNKAAQECSPATREEHKYAAHVLGALRGDLHYGLHLPDVVLEEKKSV